MDTAIDSGRQRMWSGALVVASLLGVSCIRLHAQATPEEAVRAFFAAASGEAGTQPITNLLTLFTQNGQLLTVQSPDSVAHIVARSPVEYVESSRAYLASNTQYETPLRLRVNEYGNVGNVFCSFEARRSPNDAPFYRGVASFQLLRVGADWRIVTAYWQGERPGRPLPAR